MISGGGGRGGFAVKKTGDATVVFVGPPSVGKSTLLNRLTNAQSKIGAYDFTTVDVIPGMMDYKGAKIQILDIPGIIEGASRGKGRGKKVLSVVRAADLIVIIVDVRTTKMIPIIKKELWENGVRLDEKRPEVEIIKQLSGGVKVNSSAQLSLSYVTIKELASEFRLPNVEIIIKEDLSLDRLIDCFMNNRVYRPYMIIVNKTDLGKPKELKENENILFISARESQSLDILKEKIWGKLQFIRVYLKKDGAIDYQSPLIIKKGSTLKNLLDNISICDKETFTKAKISGPGAKYQGQEVSFNFVPQDETVVQFV